MSLRFLCAAGFAGLVFSTSLTPAWAQNAAPNMTCQLFPLACPGPVPPAPAPLLGTPDEQAQAAPAPVEAPVHHRHRARKHAAKPKAE